MRIYIVLLAFLLVFFPATGKAQTTLTLATTHWCPYTCIDEGIESNIIGEYVSRLLAKHNVMLKIEMSPWSRAIKLAKTGHVDGLLTATHSEAPTLNFTQSPIAHFQVCFYTHKNSPWRYDQPMNLQRFTLGIIQDYGYSEEIDHFIVQNAESEQIIALTGSQNTPRLLNMLIKERVDIIVEDKLVINWQANKNNLDLSTIVNAGCTKPKPFYLALNKFKKSNQNIINILNKEFTNATNQQKLQNLIAEKSL